MEELSGRADACNFGNTPADKKRKALQRMPSPEHSDQKSKQMKQEQSVPAAKDKQPATRFEDQRPNRWGRTKGDASTQGAVQPPPGLGRAASVPSSPPDESRSSWSRSWAEVPSSSTRDYDENWKKSYDKRGEDASYNGWYQFESGNQKWHPGSSVWFGLNLDSSKSTPGSARDRTQSSPAHRRNDYSRREKSRAPSPERSKKHSPGQ